MEPSPSFEESIKQAMQTLPPVIRSYIAQGAYTQVAKGLMAKYDLHIDQATMLEREIMLLLMGVESPDDFVQALAEEAKLDQSTIKGITEAVNTQIFVPLRKEEERATTPATVSVAAPIAIPAPAPRPTPPHIAPLPPKVVLPPAQGSVRNILTAPSPVENNRLLEDHEEPSLVLEDVEATTPSTINRIPIPTRPSAPVSADSPPANLPGAMPPIELPIRAPRAVEDLVPPPPRPTPPAPMTPAAPRTAYSADPYREPIDEPVDEM